MALKLILLAAAGALGTLSRYGLGVLVEKWAGGPFPWGIFAANMLGCLMFGFVFEFTKARSDWSPDVQFVVLTGFMGAFTTFSTYAFQTSAFLRESQWGLAMVNITAQNVVGIACVFLGVALGKVLAG